MVHSNAFYIIYLIHGVFSLTVGSNGRAERESREQEPGTLEYVEIKWQKQELTKFQREQNTALGGIADRW